MKPIKEGEKILLLLVPFWDPQIPPLGLACLKSYLRQHHYDAKTMDLNLNIEFRELHDHYFNILENCVPKDKIGNLYNIGNEVLRNHLMAHLNYVGQDRYLELIRILLSRTFYSHVEDHKMMELDEIIREFYTRFNRYFLYLLEKEKPAVLGLSVYGDTLPASLAAFKLAKQTFPAIKNVMGGGIFADQLAPGSPDLDFFVEETADFIDKIIIGEGEELLLRFLRGQLEESQKVSGMKDIETGPIEISTLAVPDFSDFDLVYYPHLAHYGARSCPHQCKFCSETINWGRYRKKDVRQTVEQFMQLYKNYNYQLFLMTDSTLNPIISDLSKEFIKSQVSIYWDGFLRADKHVSKTENTLLWRQGGFYRAKLGLESGSQRILDAMDKRILTQYSESALAALAYAGIKTTTFWLFGFPGETDKDFQLTLDFIERNQDNIYEADCNAFHYYLKGQANSEQWLKNNNAVRLYPPWAKKILLTETWIMDCSPSREEAYQRVNHFIKHCRNLGIPNPYSLNDVYKADERWKKMHKNAVPSLVELKNKDIYIEESKYVKKLSFAQNPLPDDDDWL